MLGAFWAPSGQAAGPIIIPPGGQGQVLFGDANVLNPGDPNCTSQPGTYVTIVPSDALEVLTPLTGVTIGPGSTLTVHVKDSVSPGVIIGISWATAGGNCYSANGIAYVQVGPSGGSGSSGAPTVAPGPIPAPPAGVRRTSCGYARYHGKKIFVVTLKGKSCKAARRAARSVLAGKRPKGYDCVASRPKGWLKSAKRRNRVLWICAPNGTRSPAPPTTPAAPPVVSLVPPGGDRCATVEAFGHTYDVWKAKVLCRFARNTARRMITGETPYIYEFTNPSQGYYGRWYCEFYGATAGSCIKNIEGRFVFWMLRR